MTADSTFVGPTGLHTDCTWRGIEFEFNLCFKAPEEPGGVTSWLESFEKHLSGLVKIIVV